MDIKTKLWKKAQIWANIIGHCPGVKAIFLSGSLAQNKATKNSDIDFFIITQKNKIWTARFWVFIILKLTHQIANEKNHAQKICPNHFITEDNLEIKEKDTYAANLFAHNIPLYDPENIFEEFKTQNKDWIKNFKKTFQYEKNTSTKKKQEKTINKQEKKIGEKFLEKIQTRKIKKNPHYKRENAKIILSDTELRFHPSPKNKNYHAIISNPKS